MPADRDLRTEGWTYLWNSPKWHYFREGRSLCGNWMIFGKEKLEGDIGPHPKNCKACFRKRDKELAKNAEVIHRAD